MRVSKFSRQEYELPLISIPSESEDKFQSILLNYFLEQDIKVNLKGIVGIESKAKDNFHYFRVIYYG